MQRARQRVRIPFDRGATASAEAGRRLQPDTLVIIESTVAPGTTQNVVQPILERESGLEAGPGDVQRRFYLAFSYERVMPGKLLEYITDFPRVVGGVDAESTRRAMRLYRHIVRAEITPTDVLTADMSRVVENTYRDVNIAFANEVALLCESMRVNVFEVRELINARPDRRVHLPGAGVGGHCLPKDSFLAATMRRARLRRRPARNAPDPVSAGDQRRDAGPCAKLDQAGATRARPGASGSARWEKVLHAVEAQPKRSRRWGTNVRGSGGRLPVDGPTQAAPTGPVDWGAPRPRRRRTSVSALDIQNI
ncbi:MAG TPA: hypothetical protein ENN99_10520 [Chloroflexi bacterium]|nr:hypothetical protein [Chloroflexota bacterium]